MKNFKFPIWGWFYVFFGILFIANGIFVYLANTSFTGVSSENAYAEGINYNDELARKKRQHVEGWRIFPTYESGVAQVKLETTELSEEQLKAGVQSVTVNFVRPTHSGHDVAYKLSALNATTYRVEGVKLPLKGQWDMHVNVMYKNNLYKVQERLMVTN